ncbi:anthocyanidin 3-O-glucosyltransferase 5-like [Rosa sericea]
MEITNQHAALLCSPGMGHLVPVLELGKRLVTHQNFTVTIFVVPLHTSKAESELLDASAFPRSLDIIELPSPDVSGVVDPDAVVVTRLAEMMRQVRPAFRAALHDMINFRHRRPTMLIVDLFGTESLPIAEEFGIRKYVYIASNAWFLSVMIYSPTLDEQVKGKFVDLEDPLEIPGCRQLFPELDIVDALLDRSNQQYDEHMLMGRGIPKGDGILINIWEELEPKSLAALRDEKFLGRFANVPVFPIGPLMRPNASSSPRGDVFDWLDEQPNESVIYVSFGSGGALSYEQMVELAWGLEMSQQRFVWVIRPPIISSADETFFTAGNHNGEDDNLTKYLPKGFLGRTKDIGFVIPLWAPQVDILAHPSVGGFLTHCGWNSTLESITNGVPMIAWPLYAEQRLNATLLTEELGVAVRSKIPPWKNVVEREEIEEMVRKIMEDKEGFALRDRAKNLKFSGAKALEQGGSSYDALSQFTKHAEMFVQFANGVDPSSQVP